MGFVRILLGLIAYIATLVHGKNIYKVPRNARTEVLKPSEESLFQVRTWSRFYA